MPVNISATASSTLDDTDTDGVADPGEVLHNTIRVVNNGDTDALNVTVTDPLNGSTIDAGSVQITPIAVGDAFDITGNTPITFSAAQLLGNDIDPDGPEANLVITGVSAGSNGTVVDNGDGTYTFTPTTGLDVGQTATFTYTVEDEDGIANVTGYDGTVTLTVTDVVWYVDNEYDGSNGASDGSYLRPFTSMAELNGATGDGSTNDDVDSAGETIFVYQNGTATSGALTLENGQNLYGDGHAFTVNGLTIGNSGSNTTITASSGNLITLAQNNTIDGVILSGTGTAGGIAGSNFGTLTVSNTAIDVAGQGLSLTTGAVAGTGFQSLDSDGGVNNVSLTGVTGTLNLGNGALSGASGASFNVSGGTVTVDYNGTIGQASNAAAVNVSGHATGSLTFDGAISATNGTGLQFDNADGTYDFNGQITLNGGDAGVDIVNGSSGTFTFDNTSNALTNNAGGDAFTIANSNANVTWNGNITDNNSNAVNINEHDGGTVTFQNGAIGSNSGGIDVTNSNGGSVTFNTQVTLSTGANTGVNLTGNTGSTIAFNSTGNGLDITTTSGAGFNATGGGTVTVTGSGNTISSGTGTALNIQNTTIGAAGVNFQSISANGGANGIVLSNTGTAGGLAVTGNGTTVGGGGTIQNTSGDGVSLTNTANVALNGMIISNTGAHGVSGTGVTNVGNSGTVNNAFSFTNGLLDSPGNGDNESALYFDSVGATNITGRMTVSNTTIQNFEDVGLHVGNVSGSLVIDVTDTVFSNNSDTNGEEGIDVDASGTANIQLNVSGTPTGLPTSGAFTSTTRFIDLEGGAINGTVHGSGVLDINLSNTLTTGTGGPDNFPTPPAMTFSAEGSSSTFTFDILNNRIDDSSGDGIFIGHEGTIEGRITGNTITNVALGDGIRIDTDTSSNTTSTILISNNTITNVGDDGIQVLHRDGTKGLELTITGNTIQNTGSEGIRYFADDDVAGGGPLNLLSITSNTFGNNGTADFSDSIVIISQDPGTDVLTEIFGNTGVEGITLTQSLSGVLSIEQASLAALQAANTMAGGGVVTGSGTITFNNLISVPLPTNPLLAEAPQLPVTPEGDPATEEPGTPTDSGEPTGEEAPSDPGTPPEPDADPAPSHPVIVDDGVLSQAELDWFVYAAIERWIDAGASAEQVAAMRATSFSVTDMTGIYLGASAGSSVEIDSDAAGFGWYLDATPDDDAEFTGTGTRLSGNGDAAYQIDLLTTILHELGHAAGLEDTYLADDRDSLMYGYAAPGERRLPGEGEAAGATPHVHDHSAFMLGPVNVGTLPAGTAVEIYYDSTVNDFDNEVIPNPITSQPTVTGSNFADYNLPLVSLTVDSLTLGNLVFNDVNGSGTFDAGDSGIDGVTLSLFADADDNGVADGAAIATTTTAGGGLYSFANLAEGTYIVQVDAANFGGGGALAGLVAATNGGDPDNNVNDDSNGGTVGVNGSTAAPITLSYNNEPTPGVGNDNNPTLDFGFLAINDAPTSTGLSGDSVTWTEGDPVVLLDDGGDATLADADSADFDTGTLTVAITAGAVTAEDVLAIRNVGVGAGQIGVSGANVTFGGTIIGSFTGGSSGASLVITFNASATVAAVQELLRNVTYDNTGGNAPTDGDRTVSWTLVDGDGTANGGTDTLTFTSTVDVVAVDGLPVAVADGPSVDANVATDLDVIANDTDDDGGPKGVIQINGSAVSVGVPVVLASGASVTLNADGTIGYDPNGEFDYLVSPATALATGASNGSAVDSFTYTLNGGSSTTVTVTVLGVDEPGDELLGTPAVDTITGTGGDDVIRGLASGDFLDGGDGDDAVYGNNGNDTLAGGSGNDDLFGSKGVDRLVGGQGADSMFGGDGNDTYQVSEAGDLVSEVYGEGIDRVFARVDYTLTDNVENLRLIANARSGTGNGLDNAIFGSGGDDTLFGLGGDDRLFGLDGNDTIEGGDVADRLFGGLGMDILLGGDGHDWLEGGAGTDTLTGGTGRDVFVFRDGDTAATWVDADVVTDFNAAGTEMLRLDAMDADTGAGGNQAFSFIGNGAFTGVAGQLHYVQSGGMTYVEGDTDGDSTADFVIALTGTLVLVADDFVL